MNILLNAYFDRNFGDDMMVRIVLDYLRHHNFYITSPKSELFLPFESEKNLYIGENVNPDVCLNVTGSGFIVRNKRDALNIILSRRKHDKNVKKAVIGCSLEPFSKKVFEFAARKNLKAYDFITVRDKYSYTALKNMFPDKKIMLFPDILFAMKKTMLVQPTGENLLGISVRRDMFESNLNYYKCLAQTADFYIKNTGKNVILFAFDIDYENDLSAAVTIKSMSRFANNIEIVAHTDCGDNIIKNFVRCGKIIATRFHSCVLSIKMGIDFVPIAYGNKTVQLLNDIGYNRTCFDIHNLDAEKLKNEVMTENQPIIADSLTCKNAENHMLEFEKFLTLSK